MGLFDKLRKRPDVRPAPTPAERVQPGTQGLHGFILTTESGSTYSFSRVGDAEYYTMSSNTARFGDNDHKGYEVEVISPNCMNGDRFKFNFTENAVNGSHAGEKVSTSPIAHVRTFNGLSAEQSDARKKAVESEFGDIQTDNTGVEGPKFTGT